jgi:ubiquinone/menaquinone biosynthesis C-methylase UbiE
MRVLDLGCGAGDVSMLAGTLVGASGSVVGIDRSAQALAVARERAQAGGFMHVGFTEASVDTFSDPVPFDLVVARYVLMYQVDPIAFLQAAAHFAGRAGILALQEPLRSRPHVVLWQQKTCTQGDVIWGARLPTPSPPLQEPQTRCHSRAVRA